MKYKLTGSWFLPLNLAEAGLALEQVGGLQPVYDFSVTCMSHMI